MRGLNKSVTSTPYVEDKEAVLGLNLNELTIGELLTLCPVQ
jgi:hypothetical protein